MPERLRVMRERAESLRERISLLAAADRAREVFGAATHDYRLEPPLDGDTLAALERRLGVALPPAYRALVQALGASGAGPYHGRVAPVAPPPLGGEPAPDPRRSFGGDDRGADTLHLLDGTLVLAEHGGGGARSILVVTGPCAGEVWRDATRAGGLVEPEAPDVIGWYEAWGDAALCAWVERAAPGIALDGPTDPAELEAVACAFELFAHGAAGSPGALRTLGYLHAREHRWADAASAFAAAAGAGGDEPAPRLALDRARLALIRGDSAAAIASARAGLALDDLWYATRDELRDALERALAAAGRPEDALAVLDARAADAGFSLALHHRLAREHLARGDTGAAGAALERAAAMEHVLGAAAPIEVRVPACFTPIVAELRSAGRRVDAEALALRAELILGAN